LRGVTGDADRQLFTRYDGVCGVRDTQAQSRLLRTIVTNTFEVPMKDSDSSHQPSRSGSDASLAHRFASLESQIERLTDLLAEQATTRMRRRRRLTIRAMLSAFVVFAIFFAWFGNVYHRSRRQARSVDRLISQNALSDLSHCRELQQLVLERTSMSDSGLKHLESLSQLRYSSCLGDRE
jgi:hypothetical protein